MRYYIADPHFFHGALNTKMDRRGFESVEAMNEYMLRQWNRKVRKNDEVVILGDLSWGKAEETNELLEQLNGRLYLIQGNHDRFLKNKDYNAGRFVWIKPYEELQDNKRKVILCHYPIMCYNGQYRVDEKGNPKVYMLYGHVHDTQDQRLLERFQAITRETASVSPDGKARQIPCNMINCFCMYSDYVPLTLDEWIACEKRRNRFIYHDIRETDSMPLSDNEKRILQIETEKEIIFKHLENPLISQPFTEDFARRFSWSTNAIEGNTLSLEETIAVIDYDEVRSNHTYSEYTDVKKVYYAIREMLLPFKKTMIDEEWIRKANGYIRHMQGDYRDTAVYIGNLSEAVYYPPDPQDVPELMKSWLGEVNIEAATVKETFEKIAASHIRFERIHPFLDGNGRTGRMVVNQQLINNGLLPVSIQPTGKYREAFRRYDKKNDLSEMVYVLLKSELESFDRVRSLALKLSKDRERQEKEKK